VFPAHQQQQIRIQLATTLRGVISQQLITRADGKGRLVAVEVMIGTAAVSNMIREGKSHQLNNVIQSSGNLGMRMMDDAIFELYKKGSITRESVIEHCIDTEYMKSLLLRQR
jgi:twitching motility protein PilT